MSLKLYTAPAAEPISLAEAKLHLRVDIADDDELITAQIKAAREYVEQLANRSLITQTWEYTLEAFPDGNQIVLPRPPLVSVTSVVYTDYTGTAATFSSLYYTVDTYAEPGQIVLKYGQLWPAVALATVNGVCIRYTAGYGATGASVPQRLRQAILLLLGHWYENREAVQFGNLMPQELPFAVQALLWSDRIASL